MHTELDSLKKHLGSQAELFASLDSLHGSLLIQLDQSHEMGKVLELLEQKNKTLDEISKNNLIAKPWLDFWLQNKESIQGQLEFDAIQNLLTQVEELAQRVREQDEQLLKRFEKVAQPKATPTERSNNVLNAFRALR